MIFILYFISNISIEYLVLKNELSVFTKMINLILPDIGYFSKNGYDNGSGSIFKCTGPANSHLIKSTNILVVNG